MNDDPKEQRRVKPYALDGLLKNSEFNFVNPPDKKTPQAFLEEVIDEYSEDIDVPRKQAVSYDDGFAVDEDTTALQPTYPVVPEPVPSEDEKPLVFSIPKVAKSANVELGKKLANVRRFIKQVGKPPLNETKDYSYLLFTYQGRSGDEISEPYIFTGDWSPSGGGTVRRNTLLPLKELKNRVWGPIELRRKLYMQDWLTASSHFEQKHIQGAHPNFQIFYPDFVNVSDPYKNAKDTFDGSHLPLWDTAGSLQGKEDSVEFLLQLLQPPSTDAANFRSDGANLPDFIFERWCRVALAAAGTQKDPYSVNARFWNIPKDLNIKVYYQIFWNLEQRLKEYDQNKPDDEKLLDKGRCKVWEEMMRQAHQKAEENAAGKDTLDPKTKTTIPSFGLWDDRDKTLEYRSLGFHPQMMYRAYVSAGDFHEMNQSGYRLSPQLWPFPLLNDKPKKKKIIDKGIVSAGMDDVTTRIKQHRINVADKWPRKPTQMKVMNGKSATEIAKDIWNLNDQNSARIAEWLHRCAYSFGGLDTDGNPGTSQSVKNLVFGTYEANTHMIRYEAYLKRLATRYEDVGKPEIDLRTSLLNGDPGWGNDSLSWLVPGVKYKWNFKNPIIKVNPKSVWGFTTFSTFSRFRPTRFEAELDEYIEDEWEKDSVMTQLLYDSQGSEPLD